MISLNKKFSILSKEKFIIKSKLIQVCSNWDPGASSGDITGDNIKAMAQSRQIYLPKLRGGGSNIWAVLKNGEVENI